MTTTRLLALCLSLASLPPSARAEGLPDNPKPSSKERLVGAFTVKAFARSIVPMGGGALRVYDRATGKTKMLRPRERDSISAVASDESGRRLLVAWKEDRDLHLFDLSTGKRSSMPRPNFGGSVASGLAFSSDGKSAFVFNTGGGSGLEVFRLPLDGKSEATQLFGGGIGTPIWWSSTEVITRCQKFLCPNERIVHRDLETGAETVLTQNDDDRNSLSIYRAVPGSEPGDVLIFLNHEYGPRHRLLRFRAKDKLIVDLPLPAIISNFVGHGVPPIVYSPSLEKAFVVSRPGYDLGVWTQSVAGGAKVEPASKIVPSLHDEGLAEVHALLAVRGGAGLVLHWGNDLVFLGPDGSLRSADLPSLLGRSYEWAGVDVLAEKPDELWVGVEVGASRDFVRLPLALAESRAKPVTAQPGRQVRHRPDPHQRSD